MGERGQQKPPGLGCKSMVARGKENIHSQTAFYSVKVVDRDIKLRHCCISGLVAPQRGGYRTPPHCGVRAPESLPSV